MSTKDEPADKAAERTLDDEAPELTDEAIDQAAGGAKHELDHIGNFNFKVEIEGINEVEVEPEIRNIETAFKIRKPG